ncbi:hypothetical protein [Ahrensia sp. 13_GOM-1096m]|uniref:hypothetical protein n=1 Tax=Ahrensia sp. 13_GOM-1096m TaxID=1380380 RepID=UPI0012DF15AE|nr:hypothetical protein [Ahrensia sp. 13_GOM-1096m]
MTKILLIVGSINILFAAIDVITFYTGTEYLMDSIRSANYRFLTGSEKGGLKRISGTFSEASAFANYTLALFAIATSFWLDRSPNRYAGPIAFSLFLTLLLSTSATALVGISAITFFLGCRSLTTSLQHPNRGRQIFIAIFACLPVIAIIITPTLAPSIADEVITFLEEILFSKAQSRSGMERLQWNASAYQTFLDTYGFGAGLGSARASSYLLVLLSNIGIVGTALFTIFAASIIFSKSAWSEATTEIELDQARVTRATKAGFISVLLTSFISGTVYDLGLLFYFAGGICAAYCTYPISTPTKVPNFSATLTNAQLLNTTHSQSKRSS